MTIEELEAQIQALMTQLQALQPPQNQTATGPSGNLQGSQLLQYSPISDLENKNLKAPAFNEIIDDFSLIGHNDIGKLNASLEQAIKFSTGDNQQKLAAVLIFANHIEYLSRDILKNLRRMVKISTYQSYNGTIFWPTNELKNTKDKKIDKLMMGEIQEELKQFNFPDKENFLKNLGNFNQKIILLIHKLLEQDLVEDLQIQEILSIFNNIFKRYKTILGEFKNKWPIK